MCLFYCFVGELLSSWGFAGTTVGQFFSIQGNSGCYSILLQHAISSVSSLVASLCLFKRTASQTTPPGPVIAVCVRVHMQESL